MIISFTIQVANTSMDFGYEINYSRCIQKIALPLPGIKVTNHPER